jgi:hypothetical protein
MTRCQFQEVRRLKNGGSTRGPSSFGPPSIGSETCHDSPPSVGPLSGGPETGHDSLRTKTGEDGEGEVGFGSPSFGTGTGHDPRTTETGEGGEGAVKLGEDDFETGNRKTGHDPTYGLREDRVRLGPREDRMSETSEDSPMSTRGPTTSEVETEHDSPMS